MSDELSQEITKLIELDEKIISYDASNKPVISS